MCGSLFAEQHTDYRREVRLARVLASAGFAVARFHYRGFGNSAAVPRSLEGFTRDALDVTEAAIGQSTPDSRVAFLGVGAGSLVASRALSAYPGAPLLLWKPVLDGAQFFKDFFRARLIAATGSAGRVPVPPASRWPGQRRTRRRDGVHGHRQPVPLRDCGAPGGDHAPTAPQNPPPAVPRFPGDRCRTAGRGEHSGLAVYIQPVKLAEDPWFIPDGADIAASILGIEDQLIADTRDWLRGAWETGE